MSDFLRAPYPFFGGKSRVAPLVWSRFGDVPNFCEPFFGSGAVLLGRPGWDVARGVWSDERNRIETVNDLDCHIANFFRALQAEPEAVAQWADWPVNECIPAGTMIATPNGDVPVEEIHAGMIVIGERDGEIVETLVIATKQGQASDFYDVGPLRVTGNHPIWTAEHGYREACNLNDGLHIMQFNSPVDKPDIVMLYCPHGQSNLGGLHVDRSAYRAGALCGGDVSRQEAIQRAHVPCNDRWQNTPRLLDTLACHDRIAPHLSSCRARARGWLARCRTALDSTLSPNCRFDQSYRWRRRSNRLYSNARTSPEMVENAPWCPVCARPYSRNAGSQSYSSNENENQCSRYWQTTFKASAKENGCNCTDADSVEAWASCTKKGSFYIGCQTARETIDTRTPRENLGYDYEPKSCYLHRDWHKIFLYNCNCLCAEGNRIFSQSSDTEGLPLQRISLQVPVTVYNFQTDTHNYFANRILVHNCDLHARHQWLIDQVAFRERMHRDPDYYDVKVAGWWVWGICCWIGSGWCVNPGSQQLPHLGGAGRGMHRASVSDLYAYMAALAARLRRVRVCCGDFERILGPTPTYKQGQSAIFLDPPYSDEGRDSDLYAVDSMTVAHRARDWALANGDNPLLRIALCGYEGEHEMPDDWECVAWKAGGGYASQGNGANQNRHRERIWFSPHCLRLESEPVQRAFSFDIEEVL